MNVITNNVSTRANFAQTINSLASPSKVLKEALKSEESRNFLSLCAQSASLHSFCFETNHNDLSELFNPLNDGKEAQIIAFLTKFQTDSEKEKNTYNGVNFRKLLLKVCKNPKTKEVMKDFPDLIVSSSDLKLYISAKQTEADKKIKALEADNEAGLLTDKEFEKQVQEINSMLWSIIPVTA